MTIPAHHDHAGGLEHYALITDDEHTIERALVPHLRRSLAAQENVLMVVGRRTAAVVRDRLGRAADDLLWAPTDRFYQRLGFTYSNFLQYLQDQHSRLRRVHLVTEPDLVTVPETPVDRAAAHLNYEAMANGLFADYGCPITCIWHDGRQTAPLIERVRQVHPREWTASGAVSSPAFLTPDQYFTQQSQPDMTATPPVTDVDITVEHLHEVAASRATLARWAARRHFVPTAVGQVVAAASEVITNGLHHGRPPVRVRGWLQDATLVIHVEDHGGRRIPADAGYRPPTSPADSTGLWVARQLADVLLTRTDSGRTAVRMYFPYAVVHRHLEVPGIA